MFTNKTIPSKAQFLLKAENYCAYQERSTYEVKNKLLQWGVSKQDIEEIISHLIEKNFLNEIRFAQAYAHEKFHINGWGRYKIKYALKSKFISEELILQALQKIDKSVYIEKLKYYLKKKSNLLKEKDPRKRRHQLFQYALAKGFEQELINELLK